MLLKLQNNKVSYNKLHKSIVKSIEKLVQYIHIVMGYQNIKVLKSILQEGFSMNIYTTDKIRNVVLLGHGGCGKTSLAEAMAYLAGLTTRMGTVADGNTISDYDKEENKRQFSIHTSVIPIRGAM